MLEATFTFIFLFTETRQQGHFRETSAEHCFSCPQSIAFTTTMEAPTADPMVHAEKEAERAENELVEVDTPDVVQEAISKNTETAEVSVNSTITTNEEVTERMQVDAAVVSVEGSERPLEPSMGSGKEPLGTLGEAVEDGVEKNDVEDPEGDAEVEGEGEEDGEEGSGSEDEDEEEDEEEEEDESDGDESEDLEGSPVSSVHHTVC